MIRWIVLAALPRVSFRVAAALCTVAAGCSQPAAPAPDLALAPTRDTVIAPYVAVTSAVPLSDGRWVVLAPEEGAVAVVDLAGRTVTPHASSSPDSTPGVAVLIGVGDTLVIGNWTTQRFTTWSASGDEMASMPVPAALSGAFPRGRDAAGQWYFEIGPRPGLDGSGLRDSTALVRSDPALTRFDTIAQLAPQDVAEVATTSGKRLSILALSGRDRWGVQKDGTLWIARRDQNYLQWFPSGGEAQNGPRLPDPVLPVQDMDRQLYVNRFPEEYRDNARQVPFAAIKPPFDAVLPVRPGVWLFEKHGLALDSTRAFQLVDAEGVVRRLIVPSRGNALGYNGTHLLMGEQFPGGTRLMRYLVPPNAVAAREKKQ